MKWFRVRAKVGFLAALILLAGPAAERRARAEGLPPSLLPDDTAAAAFFPVATLLSSPGFEAVRAKLPDRGAKLDEPLDPKTKLTARNVESVLVAVDASSKHYVLIVTLREDANEEAFRVGANDKSETAGDYDLYMIGGDRAACLVDERTLLVGPPDTVRAIMRRPGDAEISAELAAAWTTASEKPAYGAALGSIVGKRIAALVPPALPVGDVFEKLESVTVAFDVADPIGVTTTVRCADASAAQQLKGLIDALAPLAMTPPAGGRPVLLESAKTSVAESTLTVRATLNFEEAFRAIDEAILPRKMP